MNRDGPKRTQVQEGASEDRASRHPSSRHDAPHSPANADDRTLSDECPESDADTYRIGYRNPPMETRFRRGTSGNPRGRPKGARNLAAVVAATLGERVVVNENGRRKRISKLEAAVKQLVNRAAGGEVRSMQLLLALVQASEAKPPADLAQPNDADAMVLAELKRRFEGGGT